MRARFLVLVATAGLAVAACNAGSSPSPAASPSATSAPEPTPRPSPEAVPEMTSDPVAAMLIVDGTPVGEGAVGSYSVGSVTSDSPWLPGTPVTVASGNELEVVLGHDRRAAEWSAGYVPADGLDAIPVGLADGTGPVGFRAPPPGRWSVQVFTLFEGGGTAAFYWDVTVEEP